MFEAWWESIRQWTRGRSVAARLPVLAASLWLAILLLVDPARATIFGAIDLGIHEAGHVVFRFGGDIVCAFGGSLLQCLAPLAAAVVLARIPDWFGVTFCGVWLAVNLYEVARYVGDARALALPLVTIGGGDARHDWNFLLGEFGLLRSDTLLAGALRVVAFLVMWSSLTAGAWLLWRIRCDTRRERAPTPVTSWPSPTRRG